MPLNDEDRRWFSEQLGVVRSEFVQDFKGVRQDINAVRQDINAVRQRVDEVRQELLDKIEQTETNLLTEFHKWASPMEARQRSHSATLRALDLEVETLTDKVKKLEENRPS